MPVHVNEIDSKEKNGAISYISIIIKSFVCLFLISTILLGAFRSISMLSFSEGIKNGVIFGFFLSIIIVPIMTLFDILQRIFFIYKFKKTSFEVYQKREFLVTHSYNILFDELIEILKKNKFFIDSIDKKYGMIAASSGRSWKSFGEKLSIGLHRESGENLALKLSSKPILSTTLLDYGKNFHNIQSIIRDLEEFLQ